MENPFFRILYKKIREKYKNIFRIIGVKCLTILYYRRDSNKSAENSVDSKQQRYEKKNRPNLVRGERESHLESFMYDFVVVLAATKVFIDFFFFSGMILYMIRNAFIESGYIFYSFSRLRLLNSFHLFSVQCSMWIVNSICFFCGFFSSEIFNNHVGVDAICTRLIFFLHFLLSIKTFVLISYLLVVETVVNKMFLLIFWCWNFSLFFLNSLKRARYWKFSKFIWTSFGTPVKRLSRRNKK